MNEFLAEMYNTRENIGLADGSASDVEKLAEAQILSDELAAEGYDASELPAETLMKVAYELWGENSALVKAAAEEGEGEEEAEGEDEEEGEEGEEKKGFEEKVAEADFLGRVMAHSFVNEQSSLEKEALSRAQVIQRAKDTAAMVAKRGKKKAVKAGPGKHVSEDAAKKFEAKVKADRASARNAAAYEGPARAGSGGSGAKNLGPASKGENVMSHFKRNKGKYIGGALGAGALGGGLYAMSSDKKKAASALNSLAEERALEMLKEAGYLEDDEDSRLKEAVDERALELLEEYGVVS